jgi:hypothetical protein
MTKHILTQEDLKKYFRYNDVTGIFTWITPTSNRVKIGSVAGCYDKDRNRYFIRINGYLYLSHRLAWLYMTGEWPNDVIDHINGDSSDNRYCNLRSCSQMQNTWNAKLSIKNTSGHKGVSWSKERKKWVVMIKSGDKYKHIGRFIKKQDAINAMESARRKMHGEFYKI